MPVITPRLTGHNARRWSGIIGARWPVFTNDMRAVASSNEQETYNSMHDMVCDEDEDDEESEHGSDMYSSEEREWNDASSNEDY